MNSYRVEMFNTETQERKTIVIRCKPKQVQGLAYEKAGLGFEILRITENSGKENAS